MSKYDAAKFAIKLVDNGYSVNKTRAEYFTWLDLHTRAINAIRAALRAKEEPTYFMAALKRELASMHEGVEHCRLMLERTI